ncbi:MAG: DUF1223 domain-containing protein [Gallionellaceae bacterium]|jgi:hypothetical protein
MSAINRSPRNFSPNYISSVILLLSVFLHHNTSAVNLTCETRSGTARAQLIELYTSEGCSSCPPADKWLSALVPKVLTAEEVVPLAFHVDYWDRLGWRDRFADPAYTARQHAYAKVSGSGFVFTPQVILAGRNYGAWSNNSRVQQDVRNAVAVAPDASIVLRQQAVASGRLEFEAHTQLRQGASFSEVRVYAALFQNGLVSEVGRGENSGSRLRHDYVVRGLLASKAMDQSGQIKFKDRFVLPEDARVGEMGVAVFVQDVKTGVVLQAMATSLCIVGK